MLERIRCADHRVRVDSGTVRVSTSITALTSTTGVNLSQRETAATGYVFGMAVDGNDVASFDYDGDALRRFDELEPRLAVAADRTGLRSAGSRRKGIARWHAEPSTSPWPVLASTAT